VGCYCIFKLSSCLCYIKGLSVWFTVFLQNLMVFQLVKKFPAFCRTPRFNSVN